MDSNRSRASFRANPGKYQWLILVFVWLAPVGARSTFGWMSSHVTRQGSYREAGLYQDYDEDPTPSTPTRLPPDATTSTPPILTATPAADGSIIHVVEPGQVLVNIASAYQVSLASLYTLNGLNADSVIYPGDRIIIRLLSVTPSSTATETALPTSTPLPAPTHRPTRTATQPAPAPSADKGAAAISLAATQSAVPGQIQSSSADPLLVIIGILGVMGIGLVALGNLLKRRA